TAVASATQPARRPAFLGSVLLALALATVAPWALQRLLLRLLPAHLPATRLRRSLLAALAIGANVLLVAAALQAAWAALAAGQPPSELLRALEHASIRAGAYAAFVISLGNALLARRRPSWRLLPLSDAQARRLAPYPWWIALLSAAGALAGDLNALLGVSLSAEVFTHALAALLLSLALAAFLARTRRRVVRVAQPAATEPAAPLEAAVQMEVRPLWLGVVLAAAALAVLAALLGLALGYVALAGMLARQTVWSGVVFATTYLLCLLAEDLSEALLSSQGMVGRHLHTALGLEPRLLDQLAVLASGALRVLLLFYMAIALMAPFGTGPDELFRRGSLQGGSLKIGDFVLAPQSLATAVAVLVAGFMAIRMLKRWLAERYFPNTALEPGMQSSITTLLGYIGGVVVIAIALAGLGISVERIAWVASALSVGIGFGLQAIVQNFISGLILLAERPVRVGDWVVLGDTEGDVRRINVRATEIQQWDRSTVIVPNSEFITKTVRNVTLTGAQGRLMLRLPAPLTTDAQRMRELILAAFQAHEAVLDDPAPVVQLEGIQNGTLTFLAIGWVASPRQVGGVRSDLLFAILEALRREGLQLSPPATTLVTPEAPLLDERAAAGQPPADAAG
ncbi:mechanosensitive ion channel family protein, partial [Melaminivora alkalimesophila]